MNYKRILITGSEGFIGSHLTEALVKEGYNVRVFVLYNSFNFWGWLDTLPKETKSKIDVFLGDIRDPYGVKEAMKGCDAVLHLAALIAIPYSYHSPSTYVDTNIMGTLNVIQSAKELEVKKVIHTSTSEVYGSALTVPINETHPLQGQSPYSASKIGADALALSYYYSFNTPITILRPFNTYGPRQSVRAVLPSIILQHLRGAQKISLGDTTPTRDFNFVSDIVSGFMASLKTDGIEGQTINLSSNFEVSIGECVQFISEITGVQVEVEKEQCRMRPENSEVKRLRGDNTKANDLLGWKPVFSGREGFKIGLKKTIDWYKNPDNLKNFKDTTYSL